MVAVVVGVAVPPAVGVVLWGRLPSRRAAAGVAVLLAGVAAQVVVAGHFGLLAAGELRAGRRLGVDGGQIADDLVVAALALALGAGLARRTVRLARLSGRWRGLAPVLAIVAGIGVLAALGAALARATGADCRALTFRSQVWREAAFGDPRHGRDAGARLAESLVRCGTLDGLSRAEVRRRLGRPERDLDDDARSLNWTVADGGSGTTTTLSVELGRDDRVVTAEVARESD